MVGNLQQRKENAVIQQVQQTQRVVENIQKESLRDSKKQWKLVYREAEQVIKKQDTQFKQLQKRYVVLR